MKEMKLGSNEGITGFLKFHDLDDVLAFTPYIRNWKGRGFWSEDAVTVSIVINGDELPLETSWTQKYAVSLVTTKKIEAPTICEQIVGLRPEALIFHRVKYSTGNIEANEDYKEVLYLIPPVQEMTENKETLHMPTKDEILEVLYLLEHSKTLTVRARRIVINLLSEVLLDKYAVLYTQERQNLEGGDFKNEER